MIVLFGCNKSEDIIVANVIQNDNQPLTSSTVYIDDNGITIKAKESAEIGDEVLVKGEKYTIVDEETLRAMVNDGVELSKIITSKVYNMRSLFKGKIINGDISHWDVSNVDFMHSMFMDTDLNQDLSHWDVSNVYHFGAMFLNSSFNGDISNWDVSKSGNLINGEPNNDVIGSACFTAMFKNSLFNQDISSWNVSGSACMNEMFKGASRFNQDLSSWTVNQVTNCDDFWVDTTAWTLPKPNLIISQYCNPGYRYDYTINNTDELIGSYKREPVENGWHEVDIIKTNEIIIWQNTAGANWNLEIINGKLWSPSDSPYGEQKLGVIFTNVQEQSGRISYIYFNNEKYIKYD